MKRNHRARPSDYVIQQGKVRLVGVGILVLAYTGLTLSVFHYTYTSTERRVILCGALWVAAVELALAIDYTRMVLRRFDADFAVRTVPAQRDGGGS